MESRTISSVTVLVVLVCLAILALGNPVPEDTEDATTVDDPEKVLLDCKNSDYRTYIKCLKRHKRHPVRDSSMEADTHCMENCLKLCNNDQNCEHCRRCLKKTRHRHQIITEYETECTSDECKRAENTPNIPATNITTKIDINNVINTCPPGAPGCEPKTNGSDCCPNCHPPKPCPPGGPPTPRPPYPPIPTQIPPYPMPPYPMPPYPMPPYPMPPYPVAPNPMPSYCSMPPQLTLLFQLTLGMGFGSNCNGWSPYPWSYPQPQQWAPNNPVDCTHCGHPLLHYKCHASCRMVNYPQAATNYTYYNTPECQSPHCIGGSQG